MPSGTGLSRKRKFKVFITPIDIATLHTRWWPGRCRRRFRGLAINYEKSCRRKLIKLLKQRRKEQMKLLKAPKAGASAKGRDGSTRHGLVVSYSTYHRPTLTVKEILHRNHLLGVNVKVCFWCKKHPKEENDHAHPAVSTSSSTYAWTNGLNIFPSCKKCNSLKSGQPLEKWIEKLATFGTWTPSQIDTFKSWAIENRSKLIFQEHDTQYVEKQFTEINTFHALVEHCAKHKLNVRDYVTFKPVIMR